MNFSDCLTDLELLLIQEVVPVKGFCLSIPWYAGAKNFLQDLQRLGSVLAVTAPWTLHDHDTWQSERRAWLRAGGIHPNEVLSVPTHCKPMVKGDLLIEDHPETCHYWLESNPEGRAILIDRPYNQPGTKVWDSFKHHPRMSRAEGYLEAIRLIEAIYE
jgi:hypothetical protein